MDSGVWHQVGLEFSNIDVQSTIKSQRGSQRGNNLGDKSVKVGVGWSFNIKVSSADIVDSFIVQHNGDIGVLKKGVGGKNGVVGFNDGG
jgi:hypothetical protein